MSAWITRGAVTAVLGITVCLPGASVSDEIEARASSPTGEESVEAPSLEEPDALFDDAFDSELELSSDMDRADPFESANRKVFVFNQGVDTILLDPVTRGYRFLVPELARKGVRRMFLNLESPKILVNDLLQLRFKDAGETFGRFVLNTTMGLGGLLDVAKSAGWEHHDADFGQTLGKMGVASGPYLVIPIFGPSTVRDGLGSIVDMAMRPLMYILGPTEIVLQISIASGDSLTELDANHDKLEALEKSSIDFYAAMRSAYLQSRRAKIEEGAPEDEPIVPEDEPIVSGDEPIVPGDQPVAMQGSEVTADLFLAHLIN
jgi:phospholipid-binding lipoprotein MlaA